MKHYVRYPFHRQLLHLIITSHVPIFCLFYAYPGSKQFITFLLSSLLASKQLNPRFWRQQYRMRQIETRLQSQLWHPWPRHPSGLEIMNHSHTLSLHHWRQVSVWITVNHHTRVLCLFLRSQLGGKAPHRLHMILAARQDIGTKGTGAHTIFDKVCTRSIFSICYSSDYMPERRLGQPYPAAFVSAVHLTL